MISSYSLIDKNGSISVQLGVLTEDAVTSTQSHDLLQQRAFLNIISNLILCTTQQCLSVCPSNDNIFYNLHCNFKEQAYDIYKMNEKLLKFTGLCEFGILPNFVVFQFSRIRRPP